MGFTALKLGPNRWDVTAADKDGASVTDAATMATALVKVHAFSQHWDAWRQSAVDALHKGKIFINASKTYAEVVAGNAKPDALEGIAEMHLSHPTDSHPPLGLRLTSLGLSLNQVPEASLVVDPPESAFRLVLEPEKIEEEVSSAYQAILARQLEIKAESKQCPACGVQHEASTNRCAGCGYDFLTGGAGVTR